MDQPIDPDKASPTEYLRHLQQLAASHSTSIGSWRSLEISEALGDRTTLEERLELTFENLIDSSGLQGAELEEFRALLSEVQAGIHDVQVPTDTGNPAFHWALARTVRDVEQAVGRLGHELSEEVAFGALPTGQVNGLACAVPAGGLVVALDDGVFMFLSLLAKAVATFYRVERTADGNHAVNLIDGEIPRAVEINEEGNRRWSEALVATFVYGHPEFAPWRPPSQAHSGMASSLLVHAEIFIVAHEFSHLILGHHGSGRPTSMRRLAAGAAVEDIHPWKQDEFEADRLGLEILREHHRHIGLPIESTRAAVHFLYGCLTALESTAVLEKMTVKTDTHPRASERLNRLRERLASEEGIPPDELTDAAYLYVLMAQLWDHNVSRYLEWRDLAINGAVPWDDSAPYAWPYQNDPR